MIRVPATRGHITKEWMQQVLDYAKERVTVNDVKIEAGAKAGENFAALVLRAFVEGEKEGAPWSKSFILKIMPEAEWMKKIMADKKVFHKEVEAYNEVIPYMVSVQDSQNKLMPSVPRCYFSQTDEDNNGVIMLEDMKPLGYQLADLKNGQDEDHCKLLLKNLARLHALGYKCKFSSEEPLCTRIKTLGIYLFEEAKEEWKPMIRNSLGALDSILFDHPEKEKWKARVENNLNTLFEKATKQDNPDDDFFHTICHGDAWSNNMLFKYGDDGKPEFLTLIDLQVMYYGLPMRDLGYFFCMSTSEDLRKEHLKDLLEFYRQELLSCLESLGITQITEKELPFAKLHEMYYETIANGFFQAFNGIPVLMMPQEMQVKPEEIEGKSMDEAMEVYQQKAREHIANDLKTRSRLCYLIEELIVNNVI